MKTNKRSPKPIPTTPRSFAVLQLGKLGDMTLTTPLFNAVKRLFPESRLTVITTATSAIIPEHHPSVDSVIIAPAGLLKLPKLAADLRKSQWDIYIDPKDHRSRTSQLIADLVRSGYSIGHPKNSGIGGFDAPLPTPAPPAHYVDRMLAPMRLFAPSTPLKRRPSLGIPSDAFRNADSQLIPGENGVVSVNISAGDKSRYWGLEHWEHIVKELSKRYSVAVLSSPHDRDHADEICAMRREARPIRTETILEAAAVIARSRAVVSADTSIVHLASALDIPTVGLYPASEQNAITFAPLADGSRMLMPPAGAEFTDIAEREVLNAVYEALRRGK